MYNINPRTYNEALCLSKCLELTKFISPITEEMLESMYNFLTETPLNVIGVSGGIIHYTNANGERTEAFTVDINSGIDQIILSRNTFRVINTASDSSGCSGCGGCSSNNNNNNNNNNNG